MIETGLIQKIFRSVKKGEMERVKGQVRLIEGFGIENDAHGGKGLRQLSIIQNASQVALEEVQDQGLCTQRFNANLLISDIGLDQLKLEDQIAVSDAVLKVTEIGKKCFGCKLSEELIRCPLKDEVVFAAVIKEGQIQEGDSFEIKPSQIKI